MQIPGVHVETLHPPGQYTVAQIENAVRIAAIINRGKLTLCEKPLGARHQDKQP